MGIGASKPNNSSSDYEELANDSSSPRDAGGLIQDGQTYSSASNISIQQQRSSLPKRHVASEGLRALATIAIPKNISGTYLNQLRANIANDDFQTKEMVKTFPYSWSQLYAEYYPDPTKIQNLEQNVMTELENVYSKIDKEEMSFSVEEFWLIAMALVDDVRCRHSQNHMADSPFYGAIKKLVEKQPDETKELVFSRLYSSLLRYNTSQEKTLSGLSFNAMILRLCLETLVVEISSFHTLSIVAQFSSAASVATASSFFSDAESLAETSSCASNGENNNFSAADQLSIVSDAEIERHDDDLTENISEERAGFSLLFFDMAMSLYVANENASTENGAVELKLGAADSHENKDELLQHFEKFFKNKRDLLQYFEICFKNKYDLFESRNIKMSRAMPATLFGNTMAAERKPINAPQGFFKMSQELAPKQGLVPYAFALYCFHLRSRKPGVQPAIYEQRFIERHISMLQKYRNELNKITNNDISLGDLTEKQSGLGNMLAPPRADSTTEFSALHFIYPCLNEKIKKLELKQQQGRLQESDIAWYRAMFSDGSGRFRTMISPLNANHMIVARIEALCRSVDESKEKNDASIMRP